MDTVPLELKEETLGAHLKRKRKESGLSILELSEKTRIGNRHLESIEKGEYHQLPHLPYSRGFVRAYAANVGVDVDAAATQFIIEAGLEAEVGMIPETNTTLDRECTPFSLMDRSMSGRRTSLWAELQIRYGQEDK